MISYAICYYGPLRIYGWVLIWIKLFENQIHEPQLAGYNMPHVIFVDYPGSSQYDTHDINFLNLQLIRSQSKESVIQTLQYVDLSQLNICK